MQPLLYPIKEAKAVSGYGTTKIYQLVSDGVLDARKAGSRTVITAESLHAHIAALPKATIRMGQRSTAKAA